MNLEKTEIWITTEKPLSFNDGRAIRGFFGTLYKNRPEFHGHMGSKLCFLQKDKWENGRKRFKAV
jgi:hypothetical protein